MAGTAFPGVRRGDKRAALLFRVAGRPQGERTAIVGEAVTATVEQAAAQGTLPALWLDSAAEARAVEALFRAPRRRKPPLCLRPTGCPELPPAAFERVLLLLPRGRAFQRYLWRVAAALVHPKGRIFFVGDKREGLEGAVAEGRAVVERVAVLRRKGGLYAGMAAPPPAPIPFPQPALRWTEVIIDGATVPIASCEGVFAAGRLDAGAAALIGAMEVEAGMQALDLGSGTGVVGLAAARRGARLTATDVSAMAVFATRATLEGNGIPAEVHHTVGGEGLPDGRFDLVLTNPPFHSGHRRTESVARYLIREARRLLRAGGRLYLVANAFLPYRPLLEAAFAEVRQAAFDGRYRVWVGRR